MSFEKGIALALSNKGPLLHVRINLAKENTYLHRTRLMIQMLRSIQLNLLNKNKKDE